MGSVRVLITGIGGFVGRHLARHLLETQPDVILHGTVIQPSAAPAADRVSLHVVDLRDAAATIALFEHVKPDHVYHLAAQASVGKSFEAAWETLENNIHCQFNVIQGCLALPTPPRLLIVSSGEIYGLPDHLPADESAPLRPASPYSVSKAAQDMLGLQYFLSHRLPVLRARPFNHLGPGQSEGFVAPDFARQISRIEAGLQAPRLMVGNLEAQRDFTDVRDVVRAYRLIMEQGIPGDVYNIASGTPRSIQTLLDTLLSFTEAAIEVCPDPARMRPPAMPILWGSAAHLRAVTGWQPGIPLEQTLLDVLNDSRQLIHNPQA
jgi:GDP-4-dehydro-6-deoxy-D-mannose reductase